jgi:hypothetical protein
MWQMIALVVASSAIAYGARSHIRNSARADKRPGSGALVLRVDVVGDLYRRAPGRPAEPLPVGWVLLGETWSPTLDDPRPAGDGMVWVRVPAPVYERGRLADFISEAIEDTAGRESAAVVWREHEFSPTGWRFADERQLGRGFRRRRGR